MKLFLKLFIPPIASYLLIAVGYYFFFYAPDAFTYMDNWPNQGVAALIWLVMTAGGWLISFSGEAVMKAFKESNSEMSVRKGEASCNYCGKDEILLAYKGGTDICKGCAEKALSLLSK